jgi:enediyne biosynthesis protein E4
MRVPTLSRFIPPLVAMLVIAVFFVLSRLPVLSEQESEGMASRFRFDKLPLPELSGYRYKSAPDEMVRQVHPGLRRISAFISFTGAGVALADLDDDGLPNDLVYVDPRIDQVIVAPVPATTVRFDPFTLNPSPLAYDATTMAPTGCLVGDFNEDGGADILVYYWGRSPVLFLQRAAPSGGAAALAQERFVPTELVEPFQVWNTSAVTQADFDGDGHIDLIVGNYFRDGTRVLDAAAVDTVEMPDSLCRALNGGRSRVLLWESPGHGTKGLARFREFGAALEDEVASGWTLALGAADLDGDQLPEIYFVQDFGPDRLLHNRSQPGKPAFVRLHGERALTTPRSSVVGRDTFNGMGIDFGDLNGDGVPDIFVSNITCDFGFDQTAFAFLSAKDELHRMRDGIAPYQNASEALGLSRGGWNWDARLADFDNDTVLEVLQAAGATKGKSNIWPLMQETALMNDQLTSSSRFWHKWQPGDEIAGSDHSPFYVRAGDGRYYDLAAKIGLAEPMNSRGIAIADVDGDGRLDFAMANQWEPSYFFRNTAPQPGAFLGLNLRLPSRESGPGVTVKLSGRPKLEKPSRPAIGATAKVHLPDGRTLMAQVDGGTGHSGKRSPDLHFGLGLLNLEKTGTLRVDLRWRGVEGQLREESVSLRPDRWHTLLLGEVPDENQGHQP